MEGEYKSTKKLKQLKKAEKDQILNDDKTILELVDDEQIEYKPKVVGDQMDIDKYFGLNGQKYDTGEGQLDEKLVDPAEKTLEQTQAEAMAPNVKSYNVINAVSNNEFPDYVDKISKRSVEIVDDDMRKSKERDRAYQKEFVKDPVDYLVPEDYEEDLSFKKFEFNLDAINMEGTGVAKPGEFIKEKAPNVEDPMYKSVD